VLPEPFRRAGRPAILGHRGSPKQRPENTLESFQLALSEGADGIELDVMRCATGEVVVIHDVELGRLAGRAGRVRATPWSVLRDLDVGSHLDPRYAHVRLILLPDLLETLPSSALINVELKDQDSWSRPDLGLASSVGRLLRAAPNPARLLVSSFNPLLLAAFRRAAPEIATGFLFAESQPFGVRQAELGMLLGVRALHPSLALCETRALHRWRARGYGLCAWTIDEPAVAIALHQLGVDCLISNVPGLLRSAFEGRERSPRVTG
jgi:glycerophosphoryl diester phosphodiesterase